MIICGVDPGKKGGIVVLGDDCTDSILMPVIGKEIDGSAIASFMAIHNPDIVILEKVGSRPKQGVVSMFTFGKGYGKVMGVLDALAIPYRFVPPQAWKRVVLAGTAKDKEAAIQFVRAAYPSIELIPNRCRVPQDGIADAACLAEWGRLTLDRT